MKKLLQKLLLSLALAGALALPCAAEAPLDPAEEAALLEEENAAYMALVDRLYEQYDFQTVAAYERWEPSLPQNKDILAKLAAEDPGAAAAAQMLYNTAEAPLYYGNNITFYPSGEEAFPALLEALRSAEKSIDMEYFIIDEGVMWDQILAILEEKAAAGIPVRVMYDGTCELAKLPFGYSNTLIAKGLQARVFSPVKPVISDRQNHRDHRKILIVDGKVAFTGGYNLADEYINVNSPFGYWKDCGIRVDGNVVANFARLFALMWDVSDPDWGREIIAYPQRTGYKEYIEKIERKLQDGTLNLERYLAFVYDFFDLEPPRTAEQKGEATGENGYIVMFDDEPMNGHFVGRDLFIDMFSRAQEHVSVMTPYLVPDEELLDAIRAAAQRGVEVSIITPGIPDKATAYALTKSYYSRLMEAGVHIYEFSPGFLHAKVVEMDGKEAVVGTINMDYRSLYHNYECAVWLHGVPCIEDIRADFAKVIAQSRTVTHDTIWKWSGHSFVLELLSRELDPYKSLF